MEQPRPDVACWSHVRSSSTHRSDTRGTSRERSWHEWVLTYLYVFRVVVVGGCIVAAAVARLTDTQWLLMTGICIRIGEFVESTYYIILKWGERSGVLAGTP